MNWEVFEDYYKLLGVTKSVTPEELRKLRRELSKKYHPDLVQDEQEKEKRHKILSRINNDIEVLSNPSKKYEYDVMYEEYCRQTGKSTKEIFDFDKYNQPSQTEEEKTDEVWHEFDSNSQDEDYETSWYDYGFKTSKQNQQDEFVDEEIFDEDVFGEEDEYEAQNKSSDGYNYTTGKYERKSHRNQTEKTSRTSKKGKYEGPKTTVFGDIKQSYKEVKADEKQAKKRASYTHKAVNNRINKKFRGHRNTVPGEIAYRFTKGTLHIFVDTIYEISKLGFITKDSIPKFIIRNRRAVATIATIMIASNLASVNINQPETPEVTPSITIEQPTDNDVVSESIANENIINEEDLTAMLQEQQAKQNIKIKKIHTIEYGDTLTDLAADAECTITEIKNENNLFSTDLILAGTKISIPYTYSLEDIDYFTDKVTVETGTTIKEVANKYKTDSATIIALNEEAIYENNGKYYIISDTLRVPNFATQKEVQEQKSANLTYQK